MHSRGYERVIEKLGVTGREYYDGFSPDDFNGLLDSEITDVRNILLERARQHDGVSLRALKFLLPTAEYVHLLKQLRDTVDTVDLFDAQVVTALCEIRNDEDSWGRLIDCLERGDRSAKIWIFGQLEGRSVPLYARARLLSVLKAMIPQERDEVLLLHASGAILLLCGVVPKTPSYIDASERLENPDPRIRAQALTAIDLYIE